MDDCDTLHYPVREHMRFQRRFWIVQRIGWMVLAAIPLLALTGLFADGALSTRSIAAGGQAIEYERFQRMTRLARFVVHLAPAMGERRLHLNGVFQKNYEITGIAPGPIGSTAGSDGLDLAFADTAGEALDVVLWAHPRSYGSMPLAARIDGGPALNFPAFVYP